MIPSTYSEVFANPTMLASWGTILRAPLALSGEPIIYDAAAAPTASDLQPLNAINAALGSPLRGYLGDPDGEQCRQQAQPPHAVRAAAIRPSRVSFVTPQPAGPHLVDRADRGGDLPRHPVSHNRVLATVFEQIEFFADWTCCARRASRCTISTTCSVIGRRRKARWPSPRAFDGGSAIGPRRPRQSDRHNAAEACCGHQRHADRRRHRGAARTANRSVRVYVSGVNGNTNANGLCGITLIANGRSLSPQPECWQRRLDRRRRRVTANLDITIETLVVAALAAETEVAADVVRAALACQPRSRSMAQRPPVCWLSPRSIRAIPGLVNAFTQVAKAAALFTSLATNIASFTFAVQNASSFGWLDPSALPLAPVASASYSAFEALLRGLKLQRRQASWVPKLFDVLGQSVAPARRRRTSRPRSARPVLLDVTAVSNASPIVITTATPHSL